MKIVQLYNQQRTLFGGEPTVIANTTNILQRHGHEVAHAVRTSRDIGSSFVSKVQAAFSGVYSFSAVAEIEEIVRRERPDVIHAHGVYPLWSPSIFGACRRLEIPTVLHVHCHYLTCPNWYHLREGKICERCFGGKEHWCALSNCRGSYAESAAYSLRAMFARKWGLFARNVGVFVAVSDFLRARLVAGGFPEERIKVIHNSVPDVPATDVQPAQGGYIAYCGRLSPEKGVQSLIEAARRTGLPICIAGDGPDLAALEKDAPSNVRFLGYLNREQLRDFYFGARFTVVPSLSFETFCMSAVESMMHGRPVVGARIGAIPEMVEQERAGLLFEPGNSEQLANLIAMLWANPERCNRYGRAARQAVEIECAEDTYYNRLIAAYHSAAELSKPYKSPDFVPSRQLSRSN